jgi:hypothetical protein
MQLPEKYKENFDVSSKGPTLEMSKSGLEFEKNKSKVSLSLNVTKFFRASRPVHRASRFKASLKILFSCYFEVSNMK